MKYTVKQDKNQTLLKSLKDVVLENRGLSNSDVEFLINPTDEYLEFPEAIPNMKEASELFIEQVNTGGNIGILIDPDVR